MRGFSAACLIALGLQAGCGLSEFTCGNTDECGDDGVCELNGYCSFPDPECDSGRRFGSHAGGRFDDKCVPIDPNATSSTTTIPNTTSSTTLSSSTTSSSSSVTSNDATTGTTDATAGTTTQSISSDSSTSGSSDTDRGCLATRIEFVVHGSGVSGTLTNFPVLVVGNAPELMGTAQDGSDLLFTDGTGAALDFEIDPSGLDPTTGDFRIWVRAPMLDEETETLLSLWTDPPNPTGPAPNSLWQNAGYHGVWHLELDEAMLADASGQEPEGTYTSTIAREPGLIGSGALFNGSNGHISIPVSWNLGSFSFSTWIELDSLPSAGDTHPIAFRINRDSLYPRARIGPGGSVIFTGNFGSQSTMSSTASSVLTTTAWHHVAVTYDAVSGSAKTYVDGNLVADDVLGPGNPNSNNSQAMLLGRNTASDTRFDGIIDEFRVSAEARSPEWIETSHRNQADPTGFAESSTAEQAPCPPT